GSGGLLGIQNSLDAGYQLSSALTGLASDAADRRDVFEVSACTRHATVEPTPNPALHGPRPLHLCDNPLPQSRARQYLGYRGGIRTAHPKDDLADTPGAVIIYASLATHMGLGFWPLYERRNFRFTRAEAMQLALGLCIPVLIADHVLGTRVSLSLFG